MLISSLVQLGLIFCNLSLFVNYGMNIIEWTFSDGVQNTLMSWINSCFGTISAISATNYDDGHCDVSLRIYNSCYENEFEDFPVDDSASVFQSYLFNSSNCNTVIFALPYQTDIDDKDNQEIIRALCQRCQFNIVILENSCHTNTKNILSYPATMLQIYTDALRYANVINSAMDLGLLKSECIHGLGHSLGAQTVGHLCRLLHTPCGSLYAFDPPGPFYLPRSSGVSRILPHMRLVAKGDADLVVKVGCNEGIIGTPFHSGNINVHVNGGTLKHGCQAISLTCNHRFCRKIMIDSILSLGMCQARVCESKTWFEEGLCNHKEIITLSFPQGSGFICQGCEPVDVYMDTSNTGYCQGYLGTYN